MVIKKFGDCQTLLTIADGENVGCAWSVADVTRPLHAGSQICGPAKHPTVNHDVLFNNKRCVVVAPAVVEQILWQLTPAAEYAREGSLYLAEISMRELTSSFGRQGPGC